MLMAMSNMLTVCSLYVKIVVRVQSDPRLPCWSLSNFADECTHVRFEVMCITLAWVLYNGWLNYGWKMRTGI